MKRVIGGFAACVFAIQVLPGGALAAGCATQSDTSALKIAALQQELMVAAFSCRDVSRYNSFVLAHQPELIASDGRLKAYFKRASGGEASYHAYKTELANSASLRSVRESEDFCARADDEFDLFDRIGSLASAVDELRWSSLATYAVCDGAPPVETASLAPRHRGWRARDGVADRGADEFYAPPHRAIDGD